jgi:hypothetical protein
MQARLGHDDGLHAALAQVRRLAGERKPPADLIVDGPDDSAPLRAQD